MKNFKPDTARKPIFRLIAVMLMVMGLYSAAAAPVQAESSRSPWGDATAGHWPHESSDLEPSPELIFGVLDNNIRYILMKNARPEDRVSMHLNVSAGSYHETSDQRGIAHFLEHMLFSGTENFEPGEMVKYFQRIGMKFGPDVNARTGFHETIYDLDLPSGDKKSLSEGLLVLRDYAAGALLPADEVIAERSVILAEKRTRDSVSYRTFEATLEFEMPDARISDRLPIGTEQVIRNTDRQLLKSFYDTWYRPENLSIIMVGDFDPDAAKALIEKRFSDIVPRAPAKTVPDFSDIDHQGIKPFYHYEAEAGNTSVTIESLVKEELPEDSAEYQQEKILVKMADRIVQHRINRILNAPDAPFTNAGIGSGHYLRSVRAAELSAECAPENWERSLDILEQNLRKALSFGFTSAEVNRVKKEYTAALDRAVKSASTRKSSQLARQIMDDFNQDRVFQSPVQRQKLLSPAISDATPEQLHELFKRNWNPEHRLVLVTGNADLRSETDPPEQRILSAFRDSQAAAVEKPEEGEDLVFPYLAAPQSPGKIKKREEIRDLGITRVVFENGNTLLVKKTDFKADQVLATLSFGAGESVEPKNLSGLAEVGEQVINLSGLGKLDREEIRQALAGTNTRVSFSVEEDKFVFSGSSVTDETRLLFELLYANMMDPGYRDSALKMTLRQFNQQYESLNHSVEGVLRLEGMRFLAGGDSRFGLPPLEILKKTNLSDIRQWIGSAMESSPVEIAVIGDLDPEAVIEQAAVFFGSLPERSDIQKPEPDRHPDFPENGARTYKVPTRISKGLMLVAYPTTGIWNIHDTRRLSILSDIFTDRMRIDIRERLGASYSQGAYNNSMRAYPDYGIFNSYAIIDPEDAGTVESSIRDIAESLAEDGVSDDELERALKPVLTGIKESMKTNDYWLHTVMKGAARHPVQLDWSRSIQSDYQSISKADMNKMAETYLRNSESATLLFRPQTEGDQKNTTGKQ